MRLKSISRFINECRAENLFVILFIPYSLLLLFIMPPFQVPDEVSHLLKTYYTSEGHLIAEKAADNNGAGGVLPKSLLKVGTSLEGDLPERISKDISPGYILDHLQIPLKKDDVEFVKFSNTSVYTVIPYIPQAIGVGLGRELSLSPLVLLYLGRITNILVCGFLLYFAIRKTPVYKWLLVTIALLPVFMSEIVSLSADAFTLSISMVAIAYILYLAFDERVKRISVRQGLFTLIILVLLGLSKQTYVFISLLTILIPSEKFGTLKAKISLLTILLFLSIAPSLLWSLGVSEFYKGQELISAAKEYYIHNPLSLVFQIFRDYYMAGASYVEQIIGRLGYLETKLPFIILHIPYFLVFLVILYTDRARELLASRRVKIVSLLIILLTSVTITAVGLIYWSSQTNPPSVGGIEVSQGRYFIPLVPLIFFVFITRKVKLNIDIKNRRLYLFSFLVYSMMITLISIVIRYYIGWLY